MGEQIVYTSQHASLSLSFKMIKKSHEGKPIVNKRQKFKNGQLILDSITDRPIIELVESHKGNIANGGTSFKRQTSDVVAMMTINAGEVYAEEPLDGIQEADIAALEYMSKAPNAMPPNTFKKAYGDTVTVYDRFNFAGIPRPKENIKPKRLKARIVEMLETLEERNIWSVDDDIEGEESSGQAQAKDK